MSDIEEMFSGWLSENGIKYKFYSRVEPCMIILEHGRVSFNDKVAYGSYQVGAVCHSWQIPIPDFHNPELSVDKFFSNIVNKIVEYMKEEVEYANQIISSNETLIKDAINKMRKLNADASSANKEHPKIS